jgi:NhaP-type Na+/H+ or K+/H+ antiporter
MPDLLSVLTSLAWPLAIALAWLAGEFGQRWTGLPRISFYGLVGFALGSSQIGVLPAADLGPVALLANIAFGLVLFELGNRINLRWLVNNPWIGVAGLVESSLTFVLVYLVAIAFGAAQITALLMAALSMATSPATVVRVINEQKSSGQMTERVLHLSAQNCVLAVFAFNAIIGVWLFHTQDAVSEALWQSLVMLAASIVAGAVFGLLVPALLRAIGNAQQDTTVAFALAVILLVSMCDVGGLSPVVAARDLYPDPAQFRRARRSAHRAAVRLRRLNPRLAPGGGRRRDGGGRRAGAVAGQDRRRGRVLAPVGRHLAQGRAHGPGPGAAGRVRDPDARTCALCRPESGR